MYRSLIPVLFCAALAAQQTSAPLVANRFVPADSCFVARIAAPAKWKQEFAKTQVQKLMQAQTLAPLLGQVEAQFDAAMAELRTSGEFDADLVERLMKDYAGDVVCSLQVDWSALPPKEGDAPPVTFVLALSPDGSYDLGALAAAIDKKADEDPPPGGPLRDLVAGDLRLRLMDAEEGMQVTLPTIVDGHLVMLVGADLEKRAERLLAADRRFEGTIGTAPLFMHVQLDQAMKAVASAIEDESENGELAAMPFPVGKLLDWFGFAGLQTATLTVGAEDKHVAAEMGLTMSADATGFMSMVLFEQTPKMLRLVPPGSEWFSITPFDVGAFYATIAEIWTELGDQVPMTFDAAMAAFSEEMKVRLQEDVIAHIGTELLMVEDMDPQADAEISEEDGVPMAMAGTCLGVSLRNGKAFGESIETMLRSRGLHAARKTEEYAGTKIHRLKLAGVVEVEYAVAGDLLLLVLGDREGARRNLRAVLDAQANPNATGELPAAVQKHVQALPAGWSGISVTPVGQMLAGMGTMFDVMSSMGDVPEEMGTMFEVLEILGGEMQRLGIDHMVGTTYTTRRSAVSRLRW